MIGRSVRSWLSRRPAFYAVCQGFGLDAQLVLARRAV